MFVSRDCFLCSIADYKLILIYETAENNPLLVAKSIIYQNGHHFKRACWGLCFKLMTDLCIVSKLLPIYFTHFIYLF